MYLSSLLEKNDLPYTLNDSEKANLLERNKKDQPQEIV